MSNELGANPWEGYEKAEIAEHIAEAMNDLPEDFSGLIEEIKKASGERSQDAYEEFHDNLLDAIITVQNNGAALASQVQGGAGDMVDTDYSGASDYESAWQDIPEPRH